MSIKYPLLYWNPEVDGLSNYCTFLTDGVNRYKSLLLDSPKNIVQSEMLTSGFNFLDQGLTVIHQERINSELLLSDIGELLGFAIQEKKRRFHIERGMRFLIRSIIDDDLAVDAIPEFKSALKLERNNWFVLQQLGMLHLFSPKTIDPSKARDYFLQAAKYASVESPDCDFQIINSFFQTHFSAPINKYEETTALDAFIREAYLNAALAAYIVSDYNDAVNIAKKAVELDPKNAKAQFLTAKYLVASNDLEGAYLSLKNSIAAAPYLCEIVTTDKDLLKLPEIANFCSKIREKFFRDFLLVLTRLKEIENFISNSIVKNRREDSYYLEDMKASCELLETSLQSEKQIDSNDKDELFDECARIVVQMQSGSTSNLQRKFNLGYNRAGRIMDQLEFAHIVGPAIGSKPREVLIKTEMELDNLLENGFVNVGSPLTGFHVKDLIGQWPILKEKCVQFEKRSRVVVQPVSANIEKKNAAPCFVATVTLGTNDHHILTDLRLFRNSWLIHKKFGRAFILWYYNFGPKAAKVVAENKWLKPILFVLLVKPLHVLVKSVLLKHRRN